MPKRLKDGREAKSSKNETKPFFAAFTSISLLILVVIAFSIAFISLGKEISPFTQSVRSRFWSKTDGKVIKTFASTEPISCGGRTSRGSCIVYIPNVVYTYQVEGTKYQGEKINFSAVNNFNSKEDCDNYLDAYRNRAVEIFYNSNDPNESTLSREYVYKFNDYYAGCCCGSLGLLFGLMFWLSVKDLIKIFRKQK
jgi:hypothetical protein